MTGSVLQLVNGREANFPRGGTDNYEQTEESRIAEILCYKIWKHEKRWRLASWLLISDYQDSFQSPLKAKWAYRLLLKCGR
uniref:Uncharacterized protein n=1 Tax=Ascaris lumbricoides TaxID=6252 RepID=A0A0M3I464_ASCLU